MNKIFLEISAILLCTLIGKDLGELAFFGLFLIIIVILRLIWNSAILIHGLGHAMAIAIVDRQLDALRASNILEHRSIQTVLKSLLPFAPIFIPGTNSKENLWLAAGKNTPKGIRFKAIGGISLNLLAAIIAFLSLGSEHNLVVESPSLAVYYAIWLPQAFITAKGSAKATPI